MNKNTKSSKEFSLIGLLREVKGRIATETVSASEQKLLTPLLMNLLQTCVPVVERPMPGQDIDEIRGQWHVKRVLEIAAAGRHNVLLMGPNCAGKAQLARTLRSLLPTTTMPCPLREPASTIGEKSFVGEATLPGELTLAHTGVLLLKDLDTFDPAVLTHLCSAVETHVISVPGPEENVMLPAQFLLIATTKPCPCGFLCDPERACLCSKEEIARYRQRIKEVVHTCFALEIEVPIIGDDLLKQRPEENSATVRQRVETARKIQQRRYAKTTHLRVNADLRKSSEIEQYCQMFHPALDLVKSIQKQLHLTALQVQRLPVVARTIADLDNEDTIAGKHMAEAILYLSRFIRYEEPSSTDPSNP
jgi:magnesium chelatase family protein